MRRGEIDVVPSAAGSARVAHPAAARRPAPAAGPGPGPGAAGGRRPPRRPAAAARRSRHGRHDDPGRGRRRPGRARRPDPGRGARAGADPAGGRRSCASGSPAGWPARRASRSPARRPPSPSASCAARPRPRAGRRPRLLSGPEQDVVLRELLAGHAAGAGRAPDWPDDVRAALRTRGLRAELRDLLMRAVERGLGAGRAGRARARARPAGVGRRRAGAATSTTRSPRWAAPGAYDPALIVGAAERRWPTTRPAGPRPALARFVAVDDAQEMTPARRPRCWRPSVGRGGELLLAGDPDAATLGFRGADPALPGRPGRRASPRPGATTPTVVLRTCLAARPRAARRRRAGRGAGRRRRPRSASAAPRRRPGCEPGQVGVHLLRSAGAGGGVRRGRPAPRAPAARGALGRDGGHRARHRPGRDPAPGARDAGVPVARAGRPRCRCGTRARCRAAARRVRGRASSRWPTSSSARAVDASTSHGPAAGLAARWRRRGRAAPAAPGAAGRGAGRRRRPGLGRPAGRGGAPTGPGRDAARRGRAPARRVARRARGRRAARRDRPDGARQSRRRRRDRALGDLGRPPAGRALAAYGARRRPGGSAGRPRPGRRRGAVRRGRPVRRPAARRPGRPSSWSTCAARRCRATRWSSARRPTTRWRC